MTTKPHLSDAVLCSLCFSNEGLKLDAERIGTTSSEVCPTCGSNTGLKLDRHHALWLVHRFFVVGSLHKTEYGGAPVIQFNVMRKNEIDPHPYHAADAALLERVLGIGLFYYGPPLWAVGEVEPLKALEDPTQRDGIVQRILAEYPRFSLTPDQAFYRLRKGIGSSVTPSAFDSPPDHLCGKGRLDSPSLPVLYGSADLELCVHECRVTVEDLVHVATLRAARPLVLLDVTGVLEEPVTSFESLDMAVHMLFLAAEHAYPLARAIADAAAEAGFDGILFPSYFSLLRTGQPFLETAYGLSTRTFSGAAEHEAQKIVANIALFGHPIADGRVLIDCINRLYLRQAAYDLGFGPATP